MAGNNSVERGSIIIIKTAQEAPRRPQDAPRGSPGSGPEHRAPGPAPGARAKAPGPGPRARAAGPGLQNWVLGQGPGARALGPGPGPGGPGGDHVEGVREGRMEATLFGSLPSSIRLRLGALRQEL